MAKEKIDVQKEVLRTASRMFTKYGFAKTSLFDIAEAMGKSRTSIYTYFNNKDDLFIAVVKHETDPYFSDLDNILVARHTAIEKIKLFCNIKLNFINANQKEFFLLNREITHNPLLIRNLKKITAEREIKVMESIILEGIKSGNFSHITSKQARLASSIFYTASTGLINDLLEKDDKKKFKASCEIVKDMFLAYLGTSRISKKKR